jgi:predicted methyltransferase
LRHFAEDEIQLAKTDSGETTLYIHGSQAMQAWERELMEEAADLMCQRGGDFLEAGLGLGISALHVSRHLRTRSHVVVEISRKVIDLFQLTNPRLPPALKIVHADFFEQIHQVPAASLDGIFFDPALPMPMWNDNRLWEEVMPVVVRTLRPGACFVPFFSTEPVLRKQYLPFFDEVRVVRRPFRAYRDTMYTHGNAGDAFIQLFVRSGKNLK